uniref:Uncharacterized protein n=1 Tax=mine drainage metagenome TaxID=410659 RepID=E6PFR1_9ZZZZ
MPICQHSRYVKVFDDDGRTIHEVGCEFVQRVGANIGDPSMESSKRGFCFRSILRSALFAGERT